MLINEGVSVLLRKRNPQAVLLLAVLNLLIVHFELCSLLKSKVLLIAGQSVAVRLFRSLNSKDLLL